jgi:hypothetical protein
MQCFNSTVTFKHAVAIETVRQFGDIVFRGLTRKWKKLLKYNAATQFQMWNYGRV